MAWMRWVQVVLAVLLQLGRWAWSAWRTRRLRKQLQGSFLLAGASGRPLAVHFSPKGGCTEAVCAAVALAQKTVRVQAYSFTSVPVAAALIAAARRGVDVRILLDSGMSGERGSQLAVCRAAGIEVLLDDRHAIAHNKIVLVDDEVVLTGSFNFSAAAEHSNAENLLILHDRALAALYHDNWQLHHGHSVQEVAGKDKTDRKESRAA